MPTQLGQFITGAANTGLGAVLGLALEKHEDARQLRQQDALNYMQQGYDQRMTDYNYNKQLQMWKDTNYSAQMEQLAKAGLNPALLYGMSGGGATTTGSGAGAHVAAQAAPQGRQEIAGMGLQLAQMGLIKAQKENVEADTANKQAENPNIPKAGTKLDTEIQNLQLDAKFKSATLEDRIDMIDTAATNAIIDMDRNSVQLGLDRATVLQKARIIAAEAITAVTENALMKSQIGVNQQSIVESKAKVQQMAEQLLQGWESLDNQAKEIKIKAFTAEFQANHPGIMNLIGGAIQRLADKASKPLEGRKIDMK